MPFDQALAIIEDGAGKHFDPALVAAFAVIARPLYDAFAGRDDEQVAHRTLEELTDHYFAVGRR